MSLSLSVVCRAFEGDRHDRAASAPGQSTWRCAALPAAAPPGSRACSCRASTRPTTSPPARARPSAFTSPDDDDGGVLGPVVTVEKLQAVLVLVAACPECLSGSPWWCACRCGGRTPCRQHLVELLRRGWSCSCCTRPSTARVSVLNSGSVYFRFWKRSASIARTVGRSSLEKACVVAGEIVGGEGVGGRADAAERLGVLLLRIRLRALEHQVLEQVREAGVPRLDLIARARLHDDVRRDDVREIGGRRRSAAGRWAGPPACRRMETPCPARRRRTPRRPKMREEHTSLARLHCKEIVHPVCVGEQTAMGDAEPRPLPGAPAQRQNTMRAPT